MLVVQTEGSVNWGRNLGNFHGFWGKYAKFGAELKDLVQCLGRFLWQVQGEARLCLYAIVCLFVWLCLLSPPWPSGYKRRNQTLVPVVRARFEPRCGRPHFAPMCNGVRVCGRNCTEAREREWAEGTVSSLPGTLNSRIKFCHSTGIARSGGGVRASTTSYA